LSVYLQPGEHQDNLLRRFRKEVAMEGILSTLRRRRWFVSRGEERRMAKKRGIRRARKRQLRTERRNRML